MPTLPNDPAYPDKNTAGLTKREYIAALILSGILSNVGLGQFASPVANDALAYADALILALNK